MYEFPYKFIDKGANIVIYGAGTVGRDYIAQVEETLYCNLVAVLDKRVRELNGDYLVLEPEKIKDMEYDFLIIAVDSVSISMQIKAELIKLGVEEAKLVFAAFVLLDNKIDVLNKTRSRLMLDNIGSRLDQRLIRLEILQYYSIPQNYIKLNQEEKNTLKQVQEFCNLGQRVFPEDEFYIDNKCNEAVPDLFTDTNLFEDEQGFFAKFDGTKLYLGGGIEAARRLLWSLWFFYERDNPHTYLMPQDDGIDIQQDEIICDIGAAEGYFGIKYINRASAVYFFETDLYWVNELKKSLKYNHKAEIIRGFVGDKENQIKLDDFFKDRQKPTLIKIDVEGADLAVLRGMYGLICNDEPLVLLIAAYHRQEDYDRICEFLNPTGQPKRFEISHSRGFYWDMPDAKPPYFRRGILRAKKIVN